jgi:hypothetical protein
VSTDFAVTWLTWVLAGGAAVDSAGAQRFGVLDRNRPDLLADGEGRCQQQDGRTDHHRPPGPPADQHQQHQSDWFGVHLTGRQQLCARYR